MIGRGVHCWGDNNLLSGVQLWVVLHPSLHLLNLVVDHFSAAGFQGCCFALDWSKIFLMPSYMPLRMPAAAAVWMSLLSSRQHSLPHLLALCCTLLLADLIPWRVFSIGERLFSATEARFVTITGINFSDLASNQSQFFEVFLPKVARADFWITSCRWFHDLEAVLHRWPADRSSSRDFVNPQASLNVVLCFYQCVASLNVWSSEVFLVAVWSYSMLVNGWSGNQRCGMSGWEAHA